MSLNYGDERPQAPMFPGRDVLEYLTRVSPEEGGMLAYEYGWAVNPKHHILGLLDEKKKMIHTYQLRANLVLYRMYKGRLKWSDVFLSHVAEDYASAALARGLGGHERRAQSTQRLETVSELPDEKRGGFLKKLTRWRK